MLTYSAIHGMMPTSFWSSPNEWCYELVFRAVDARVNASRTKSGFSYLLVGELHESRGDRRDSCCSISEHYTTPTRRVLRGIEVARRSKKQTSKKKWLSENCFMYQNPSQAPTFPQAILLLYEMIAFGSASRALHYNLRLPKAAVQHEKRDMMARTDVRRSSFSAARTSKVQMQQRAKVSRYPTDNR